MGAGERADFALERLRKAVQRLDALFDIEHGINGKSPAERLMVRQDLSAPLMPGSDTWLTEQVGRLSRGYDLSRPASTC